MKMRAHAMAGLGVVLTIGSSANAVAHRMVIDDWNGPRSGGSPVWVVDLTADNMGIFACGGGRGRGRAVATGGTEIECSRISTRVMGSGL